MSMLLGPSKEATREAEAGKAAKKKEKRSQGDDAPAVPDHPNAVAPDAIPDHPNAVAPDAIPDHPNAVAPDAEAPEPTEPDAEAADSAESSD